VSRSAESISNTFVCPFADRCGCPVKFRIFATVFSIKLEAQGEHSEESNVQGKVTIFLSIPRTAALQQMVATNPMVSSTTVRRGLELLPDSASKISPSKARLVAGAVVAARARALLPFFQGEIPDGEAEGSLTRLSEKIFVEQHNQGGKHLELHRPVCMVHQFKDGVVLGCYSTASTPLLFLHASRGMNSGWPFLAGFDTTFGITSKKFELMGISINSLRRRANPVCLGIVKKEEAVAYETMYSSMEGGLFELVHNMKLFKQSQQCEICDAVREQIEQGPMRDLLKPPKSKKNKNERGEEVPFKFEIPLEKPMCDNTTKISKWFKKRKPHLKDRILQCAAHLTGIAWQKRSHTEFFDDHFEEYWTGEGGNYMLAHAGVGGTNNNCRVEGRWNSSCVKKEVAKLSHAEELLLDTAINASLEKPARRSSSQPSSKLSVRPPTLEPTSTSQPEVRWCNEAHFLSALFV
jgi:hypothetical protein